MLSINGSQTTFKPNRRRKRRKLNNKLLKPRKIIIPRTPPISSSETTPDVATSFRDAYASPTVATALNTDCLEFDDCNTTASVDSYISFTRDEIVQSRYYNWYLY